MPLLEKPDTLNEDLIAITMVLAGLFVCFWGAKFFKHVVFFVGFICGGMLAYIAVQAMFGWFNSSLSNTTLLYISLTIGILGGIFCVVVYKAAVFVVGAVSGVLFAQMVFQFIIINFDIKNKDIIQPCLLIGMLFVGGYMAFKFVEFVLKGLTAFVGGFFCSAGSAYLAERFSSNNHEGNAMDWVQFFATKRNVSNITKTCDILCWICLAFWIMLTFGGATYQYKLHRKHDPKEYDDDISDSDESSDSDSSSYESSDSSSSSSSSSSSGRKKRKKKLNKEMKKRLKQKQKEKKQRLKQQKKKIKKSKSKNRTLDEMELEAYELDRDDYRSNSKRKHRKKKDGVQYV